MNGLHLAHSTLKTDRAAAAAKEAMLTMTTKTEQVCWICLGNVDGYGWKVFAIGPLCTSCAKDFDGHRDEIAAAIKGIVKR